MLAVFSKIVFTDRSGREKFLSTYARCLPIFRAEPGVDQYHVSVDPDDPRIAYVFETFRSTDALAEHRKLPAFGELIAAVGSLGRVESESTYMSVTWSGPHAPGEAG